MDASCTFTYNSLDICETQLPFDVVTVSAIGAWHMRPLHPHLKCACERGAKSERMADIQYFFSMSCTVKPRLSR